ncbi:hypothetical protein HZC30_01945 [Candidatus Woesearchaeota archaeon]|nr:hypothetical protein [Candidatus Woesearchaeota archaeon]
MVGNEEPLPRITLQYTGLFDFDGLFAAIIDWAKNYGFMWHEWEYKHKVPSPKGAETEHKWMLHKNISEYIRYEILVTVHVWDLLEVEVEVNGKKKSLSNARIYIWLDTKVLFDWQEKFKKGGMIGKGLGKLYNQWMDRDMSVYLDQAYYRSWDLQAIIKTYFDMQSKKYAYKGYLGEG